MKTAEQKREFVRLRAEGWSYNAIAKELHIAKSTCTNWERMLSGQIDDLKREALAELCEEYGIGKKARIKKLGDTLAKIDSALDSADIESLDPAKLLDFKLKYTEALKNEYVSAQPVKRMGEAVDAQQILSAYADLIERVRSGEISHGQAERESALLDAMLKAHDAVSVQSKLDELEAIVGGLKNGD